jgi:OOP family OmpA-OmpF porin
MKKYSLPILVASGVLVLSACSGAELNHATKASPHGSAFDRALSENYLALSQNEYREGDYADSDYFARRSMKAGSGEAVAPPRAAERMLAPNQVDGVSSARTELMRMLNSDASTRAPQQAADAQTAYECWIQELEENRQPKDIVACRDRFNGLLAALTPAPTPEKVVQAPKAEPAPAPAPAPLPVFRVSFATGSAVLDASANSAIAASVSEAGKVKNARMIVSGYTDTVGGMIDNQALSQRRADAVASALRARGVQDKAITVNAFGERFLDTESGDSTEEIRNRRVTISIVR